jgi:NAD(P) transhydrogenase
MADTDTFDLVVIGSGPAGESGAVQAAACGKRVALVEAREALGGACANTGTLPSKTLRETALFLSGFRQRAIYGVDLSAHTHGLGVPLLMVHKERVVAHERERIRRTLDGHGVATIRGRARFVEPHAIAVTREGEPDRLLRAEVVLIATGSYPHRPAGIPFDDPDIDDSDEVLALDRIPRSFVVLGGGVIGCEYASIFAALGTTRVTLVEGLDRILGALDREIGDALTRAFARMGLEVITSDAGVAYEKPAGNGGRGVRLTLKSGRVLEADRLLVTAGRTGNTRGLGLEAAGLAADDRGRLTVDAYYRTAVPGICAAGDVIGWPALAATSAEQARIAVIHAFGMAGDRTLAPVFPYGFYTIPEVSMVGDTEEDARRKGLDVGVGRARYADNPRGQIINDPEGMVKLVFERGSRRLLGAHVIGERATEIIHLAQSVLTQGGGLDYFVNNVFNYPTLSDLFKDAAYDGLAHAGADGVRPD